MAAEPQNLVHVPGSPEGDVGADTLDCRQIAHCQKCREFPERENEGPVEPPGKFEARPCAVILRHALGPEMKLNDLIAGPERRPAGQRDRMVEPAQFDAENAIRVRGKFDDAKAPAEPVIQAKDETPEPAPVRRTPARMH